MLLYLLVLIRFFEVKLRKNILLMKEGEINYDCLTMNDFYLTYFCTVRVSLLKNLFNCKIGR